MGHENSAHRAHDATRYIDYLIDPRRVNVPSGITFEVADSVQSPFGGLGRRQNLLLFSEEMDNAVWTQPGAIVTIVADNATAPNGTTTADTVTWNSTGLGVRQTGLGTLDSTAYTLSVWGRNVSGNAAITFDLHDGTGAVITFGPTLERHTITITAGTGGAFLDLTQFSTTGAFEFWGWQLVLGTEHFPYSRTEADALLPGIGGTISGTLRVNSGDADTEAILELETGGTNGAKTEKGVGNRDPNTFRTGAGGDEHIVSSGALSGSYESLEATTGTGWVKRSVFPSEMVEINTSAQFEALASGGVITVTGNLTLILNVDVVTATVFDIVAGDLKLISLNDKNFIYIGTGTVFTLTGTSAQLAVQSIDMVAASTGTWFDVTGGVTPTPQITRVDLINITIIGGTLGTFQRGAEFPRGPVLLANNSQIVNRLGGFVLSDTFTTMNDVGVTQLSGGTSSGTFAEVKTTTATGVSSGSFTFNNSISNLAAGETLFRVDAGYSEFSSVLIQGVQVDLLTGSGDLFDTTGGTGTFTAVADASVTATTTNVTDSGGVARYNFAVGPTLFVDQRVTISGFVTNTIYNQTALITTVGVGFFEVDYTPFGTTESGGSFLSDSVTLTDTGTVLIDGDTMFLDTSGATDYDGGAIVYNKLTNTVQVNRAYDPSGDDPQAGTWSQEGLDQKNSLVLVSSNPQFVDSKYIATAFVNANATANGAIVNNTFTDMVFGTGGSALIEGSTIERWKLIDEVNGTFEYTGREPFDGLITFDFTMTSSGGTVLFRHKVVHDVGAGFVDLPDAVEAETAVGSNERPATKTFPLAAVTGDQIKPQITRNSGTSGITTTHATFYVTQ